MRAIGTFESQYEQSLAVLDTQTGTSADFPDARTLIARETDALLRARLQPRRQPPLRQHGLAHRSRWATARTTRAAAFVVYSFTDGQDRAGAHDSVCPCSSWLRAQDAASSARRRATRACRFRRRSRCSARRARRSCWSPTISLMMCCCSMPRRARSKSDSIFRRATPCPRPIPVRWPLSQDGRRAFVALWNASEIVELDLAQEGSRPQAGAAQARESRRAGHASLRVCVLARRQDALCRAGQSRCRCGGECGRRASLR